MAARADRRTPRAGESGAYVLETEMASGYEPPSGSLYPPPPTDEERESQMPQSEVEPVSGPPSRAGEEYRQEWAEANGKDPSEMREIHHPDGYVDRFDGRGWVPEEGS